MNFAIMNLHSTVRPMEEGNQIKSDYKHDQMKEAIDRQHRLLELDDIIEEDYTDDFVTMSQVLK